MRIMFLVTTVMLMLGCDVQPNPTNFSKVDYSGHTYIVYDGGEFDSGMVHDPDCHNDVKGGSK